MSLRRSSRKRSRSGDGVSPTYRCLGHISAGRPDASGDRQLGRVSTAIARPRVSAVAAVLVDSRERRHPIQSAIDAAIWTLSSDLATTLNRGYERSVVAHPLYE